MIRRRTARRRAGCGASPPSGRSPLSRGILAACLALAVGGAGCAGGEGGGSSGRSGEEGGATPGPVDFRDFRVPPVAPSREGLPPISAASDALPARLGFGRPARTEEIEAWDVDVLPDGTGLPPGSGTPGLGAVIYAGKCASCHGETGVEGPENPLVTRSRVDGFPFGDSPYYYPTVGSYWPYATTVFDYVRRAMPHDAPGTLSPTEVYSLVAWILWRSGLLPEHDTLSAETLPRVVMPARGRFVVDDREGGRDIR